MTKNISLIIITGQTATGKTDLAFQYAKKYNGEIINFDSRQIYKYLDIITGKDIPKNSKFKIKNSKLTYYLITSNQPQSTKLWLYDIITPDQYFSSFEYVKLAQKVIKDIKNRGKIPILVGGSYFYLKHLLYGFDYKVPPNFKLREELNKKSVNELQDILKGLSSEKTLPKMNQSDWHNPRRLIRRIEILQGQSFSRTVLKKESQKLLEKNSLFIGLRYQNKDKLRQAIIKRVEKRLAQGAIDEVKRILKMGYKKTDPGLKTIGYKQLIEYLEGKVSKEKAIENWITAEIQYAKRQYTFMKKDKNINWKD
jgi:tRNA isopentenyltransferase (miaA)